MSAEPDSHGERRFTGRHMLALVVAFFAVVIAVNLVLTFYATRTFPGLVVANSFVASQNFDRALAAQRSLPGRRWDAHLGHGETGLVLRLDDPGRSPVAGLEVTIEIGRPAHAREDGSLALAAGSDGAYHADVELAPGQWRAEVIASRAGSEVFRRRFRLRVGAGE